VGGSLLLSGLREPALRALAAAQPRWVPLGEQPSRARLLASRVLVQAGAWKEAEALHAEATRAIRRQSG